MLEQLSKPQNKNITTFKEKQYTLQEREQTDIRQNGDTSITKRQKDERSYEKQQIPVMLDRSQDTQSRRRAKSLNPQTEYARARLLNSIVDKIRQTKRTNLAALGLTEQNMKQKISRLEILMREASMSRDRSSKLDDQKEQKLDISDFLKNINEMPNDSSYSSHLNKKQQERQQSNISKNKQTTVQTKKDQTSGSISRQNNQPEISNNEYGYDFSRKKKTQEPTFSRYSSPSNYIPFQGMSSESNRYTYRNHENLAQNQQKTGPSQNMKKESFEQHKEIHFRDSNKRTDQRQYVGRDQQYNNLFANTIPIHPRQSILETINNQLSERPKSNNQGIKFMYRSPEGGNLQAQNFRRVPPINLVTPNPFKNGILQPKVNYVYPPAQNPRFSFPISRPSPPPQQTTQQTTDKQYIHQPSQSQNNQPPTQQPNLQHKSISTESQQRASLSKQGHSPRQSSANLGNKNTLGFSRYSSRAAQRGSICPLCGRNCNCPRANV